MLRKRIGFGLAFWLPMIIVIMATFWFILEQRITPSYPTEPTESQRTLEEQFLEDNVPTTYTSTSGAVVYGFKDGTFEAKESSERVTDGRPSLNTAQVHAVGRLTPVKLSAWLSRSEEQVLVHEYNSAIERLCTALGGGILFGLMAGAFLGKKGLHWFGATFISVTLLVIPVLNFLFFGNLLVSYFFVTSSCFLMCSFFTFRKKRESH